MRKKLIALAACAALSLTLAGCGGGGQQQQQQQEPASLSEASYEMLDSLSGSGTVIGQRAYVELDSSLFDGITADKFNEFANTVVSSAGEEGADYFSVQFEDGTGIVFAGCMPTSFSYGTMDDRGMMSGDDTVTYMLSNGEWSEI